MQPPSLQNLVSQAAIPGILGGLGPLAHVDFERQLIHLSAQRSGGSDQAHPVWIAVSATNIPDRTRSLAGEAESCAPWLIRYGQFLQNAGADFLVVTCNTAHGFYAAVQPQLSIPWLHLMDLTSRDITRQHPHCRRIGILATNGTVQTQLYEKSLTQAGLIPIALGLGSPLQNLVMAAIYHPQWGIKTTGDRVTPEAHRALQQAVNHLRDRGAEVIIAGCTELSVAFNRQPPAGLPWVDPLEVVAHKTLNLAWGVESSVAPLSYAWAA